MDDLLKEILIKGLSQEFSISPEKLKEVFEKVYCNYLSNSRTEVLQTTRVEKLFEDKRIVGFLHAARIYTVMDILKLNKKELKRIYGIGTKYSSIIVNKIYDAYNITIDFSRKIDIDQYIKTGKIKYL